MQPHAFFPHAFQAPRPLRPLRPDPSLRDAESRILELIRPSAAVPSVALFAGAVTGAATGTVAGPLGILIGVALGSIVGALSGVAMELIEAATRCHDERLDHDIGVIGGDLGAARSLHPLAASPIAAQGPYSGASSGRSARAAIGIRAATPDRFATST